jgi:hypothetical protein
MYLTATLVSARGGSEFLAGEGMAELMEYLD